MNKHSTEGRIVFYLLIRTINFDRRIDFGSIHQILLKLRKKKINSQKYFAMISEKKRVDVGGTNSIINEKEKNTTRRDKRLLGERDDKWEAIRNSLLNEKEDDGQFVESFRE